MSYGFYQAMTFAALLVGAQAAAASDEVEASPPGADEEAAPSPAEEAAPSPAEEVAPSSAEEAEVAPSPAKKAETASLAADVPGAAPLAVIPSERLLSLGATFPEPSLKLERLPPRQSFDFGLSMSYGTVAYWGEFVPTWIGFGLRGSWGHHYGNHRLGADLHLLAEGPVGVHTTLVAEPHFAWDFIGGSGLLIGAGVGPALMYHAGVAPSRGEPGETAFSIGPSALARIGWSQSWTRVGRRLFVFVEPKLRYAQGEWNPLVALVVGSGTGI